MNKMKTIARLFFLCISMAFYTYSSEQDKQSFDRNKKIFDALKVQAKRWKDIYDELQPNRRIIGYCSLPENRTYEWLQIDLDYLLVKIDNNNKDKTAVVFDKKLKSYKECVINYAHFVKRCKDCIEQGRSKKKRDEKEADMMNALQFDQLSLQTPSLNGVILNIVDLSLGNDDESQPFLFVARRRIES